MWAERASVHHVKAQTPRQSSMGVIRLTMALLLQLQEIQTLQERTKDLAGGTAMVRNSSSMRMGTYTPLSRRL